MINLIAIALLVGGGYGVKYIFEQKRDIEEAELQRQQLLVSQQDQSKKITEIITKQKKEEKKVNIHRDFSKLRNQNNDTVAWLYVPGTDIDMPIVKSSDNNFYLTHGFDKKYNSMGWAFADYKNTFPELSTNTIMYGHTYNETTIFSKLKYVLQDDWLKDKNKQIITLDTEKERLKFQVFSIYTLETTNDYLYISFDSKDKYQKYLDKSLKRSVKNFGVIPSTDDKILTLSTCYIDDSHRLIVQAKLIGSE